MSQPVYPEFIQALPAIKAPFAGVEARLLAGPHGQVVFFFLPKGTTVPPHSHCAQWGIVAEGTLELTIGGVKNTFGKGDSYFIADGEEHAALMLTDCWVVETFADPDRYQAG